MRLRYVCGCGGENFTKGDWTSHWQYGRTVEDKGFWGRYPKLRAIKHLMLTVIEIEMPSWLSFLTRPL